MRVAYLGLAFHQRTGSTQFLLALLRQHAEVEVFSAEADTDNVRRQCADFDEARYDAIIILQLQEAFVLLSGRHPNVTFIPMYDAMFRGGVFAWRPSFSAAKVLCFSWALRQQVMRHAAVHAQVQYFPDPAAFPAAVDFSGLRGFFWYRRRQIPAAQVFTMSAGTRFDSLTIHDAPDPGHAAAIDWNAPAHVGRLARTGWTPDGRGFAEALAAANVFFAPRPMEGIGMGFLEAMASGLCVVAIDAPTMNEVISHGVNGLLCAPGRMAPLDFRQAREIGARARQDVAHGRARWEAGVPAMLDFLLTPTATLRARATRLALPAAVPAGPRLAVVALAGGETLAAVLASVEAEWLLFLPAGDELLDAGALEAMLADVPPGVVAVAGHHLQRLADGSEAFLRVAAPAAAWTRLQEGETTPEAPAGMPVPAATLLHRALLAQPGAAVPATPPALAALLLPALAAAATVRVEDRVVARIAPGDSADQRAAWLALLDRVVGPGAAARCLAVRNAAEPRGGALPARLALGLIATLDRLSPRLAWVVDRLVLGGLQRLRQRRRQA